MRKNYQLLAVLFLLAYIAPTHAQNVLDNLRLADKMDVFFESSKSNLTADATNQLQQIVAKFKQNDHLKIRITAHTDGNGTQQANYILSDKRANVIKYFFIGQGIPPDAMVASTFGKDKPLAENATETGRKMNRRASVEVYEPAPENIKIVEKQVIVEKPVIQIKTVEKIVEKIVEKPVIVEKQVIVEKPVVQIQTVEKVVEKPVIVERQVVVEKPFNEAQPFEKMFTNNSEPFKKAVVETPKVAPDAKPFLQGVIQNRDSKAGIPATIFVKHLNGKVDSMTTENDGTYKLLCSFDEIVTMDVFAKGYFYNSQDVVIKPNLAQRVDLQPLKVGSIATITNLYFVGNEATLLKSSDAEMAKILRFMELNNTITIEIAGHVNAPGVEPKKLPKDEFLISTKRAATIRKFLIKNGFSETQITSKGYGNSQMKYPEPINEHQEELNRRVEIKVLAIE
jgi:outer membrane protein OmpA-like peptidoglycan-associated protein